MGIAETIPGVSGGTLAFITGIYDQLIESIKAFDPSLIGLFRKEGFGAVWAKINGNFLVNLMVGMVIGIGIGVVAVEHFLIEYPPIVWAFFFGLIIASIIYVGKQIKNWNIGTVIALILGAGIAFGITQLPIGATNESLWFVFLCGAVAVSALILPGISGSFILLILGMYSFILHDTLKEGLISNQDPHALLIMIVFGLGMVLGLATISRFLSWALKKHHNVTLALLTGFMIGALYKLWPWRVPTIVMNPDDERVAFVKGMEVDKVIKDINILPGDYFTQMGEPALLTAAIISLVVGFSLVMSIDYFSKEN